MAEAANKAQKRLPFSVQTTGGYKDNLGLVLTDKVDVALNTLIGIYDAYNQNGSYGTSPMKDDFKRCAISSPLVRCLKISLFVRIVE